MSKDGQEEKNLMEKLRHKYRLVVMNNETFEEMGSYKLTLLNVYIAISSVLLLVAILVILLISFTPLRRYIPGYGDARQNAELVEMNKEIQALQEELDAKDMYINNFRKIIVGEIEDTVPTVDDQFESPDSLVNVARIEEDELLRKEIETNQKIQEREILSKTVNYATNELPLRQLYFVPPITGITSADFMPEKKHYGVDIMAAKNTPVKAIMDGYVFSSDWTLETGNTIGIQHSNNLISFYKHNSALLKKVGNFVKAGEAVAIIGNTGTLSSGPHLHFELWHKGKAVDPNDYINFN